MVWSVVVLYILVLLQRTALANFGPAFAQDPRVRTRVHSELNWNWGHHFSRVKIENQRVPDVLSHVLSYNFTLPRVQLQRGIAYHGSAVRLRRVVRDLLSGQSVKLGVIGGSVSWGEGASERGATDWFSLFSSYMIQAFPKSNVIARNGCTPGVQTSYMIMCMDLSVDKDVDLVLVEYTLNDGHDGQLYDNRIVKNAERLVRRLLALPKKPAVILMHNPTHYMGTYAPGHPKSNGNFLPFYQSSEDAQGALAQYYDMQSLSLRTAVYRLAAFLEAEGFRWEQVMMDHHPGDTGHKIMADLVVYLVQEVALGLLLHPFGAVDDQILAEALPPPMYPGNLPPDSPMCILYEEFKTLVVEASGFEYVTEGTVRKPKPGFVATQPGSRLVVRINTDRRQQAAPGVHNEGQPVHVFFHHLRSYEHMGTAKFSCVRGCACAEETVDAAIPEKVSQLYLAELAVSQSPECHVAIEVLEQTSSGEHKFKVAGVVVSDQAGEPTGVKVVGGNNQAFGLQQHNGDSSQVTISKDGVFGVSTNHRRRRRRGIRRHARRQRRQL